MKHLFFFAAILLLSGVFTSCENSGGDEVPPGKYEHGGFVVNEGTFGSGNASVSFIDFKTDTIHNEIFYTENQRPVGDVLQTVFLHDDLAYLVVNESDKVEVVHISDFREKATITGLNGPRYMAASGNKGYISQWGEGGSVAVVDLATHEVKKIIPAGTGPEGILAIGNTIWVANGGGWAVDSTLMIIDTATDEIIHTLTVGYNPKEMVTDSREDVWALCYGHIVYNSDWSVANEFGSNLVKISAQDLLPVKEIPIGETLHPQHLDINKPQHTLYVGGGFGFSGIYKIHTSETSFPEIPAIKGFFYGFNIHSVNHEIYACEAPDFTQPGKIHIFSEDGIKKDEYTAGIGPNAVIFTF
jgi:hypothetical protein